MAGLQCARSLLKGGFNVMVLEEQTDVGGVWFSNYAGFAVQGMLITNTVRYMCVKAASRHT